MANKFASSKNQATKDNCSLNSQDHSNAKKD